MKPNQIVIGATYLGKPRRSNAISRTVMAIEPHQGFATMVRFTEHYQGAITPGKTMTLKSFAAWAVSSAGA